MKKFFIRNVTAREASLLNKSPELIEKGLLGSLAVSFGEDGREYMDVFTPVRGVDWSKCKPELVDFIHYLRFSSSCPAFSSRKGMEDYIALACNSPAFKPIQGSNDACISGGGEYQYFVRLSPDDEVDAVVYCYDKKKLVESGVSMEGI